ncbi:hypothetical protein AB0K74_46400, partial [Streptomyces sp. NPDC056159]
MPMTSGVNQFAYGRSEELGDPATGDTIRLDYGVQPMPGLTRRPTTREGARYSYAAHHQGACSHHGGVARHRRRGRRARPPAHADDAPTTGNYADYL